MHFAGTDADGVVVKEDCTLANGVARCSGTATDKNGNVGSQHAMGPANSIVVQVADAPASPGAQGTTGSGGATVAAGPTQTQGGPTAEQSQTIYVAGAAVEHGWNWSCVGCALLSTISDGDIMVVEAEY